MKTSLKHIWTILCQKSSVDANSNILSLFEILEKIDISLDKSAPKLQEGQAFAMPFHLEIVSYWRKTSNKTARGEIQFVFFSPEKQELGKLPVEIDIAENLQATRVLAKMDGMKFTKSGEYTVQVQQKINGNFEPVREVPFDVNIQVQD